MSGLRWGAIAFLFWFGAVGLLIKGDWLWVVALCITVAAGRQALP